MSKIGKAATLNLAPTTQINDTGIQPIEYKVLVRLDPVMPDKKIGSIFIPDEHIERQQMAGTEATLLSVGALAFTETLPDGSWRRWPDAPRPGDRVLMDKYSGNPPKAGDIENLVRICNDQDVLAVLR